MCHNHLDNVDVCVRRWPFLRKAQDDDLAFYVGKEDDNCFGKVITGMIPKEPFEALAK